ncbi:chloride channel protein [Terrabacter aerolatus]|nr:chloride channel protein [Terrabacter aerolatus]
MSPSAASCTGSRTPATSSGRGPEWLRPAVGGILLGLLLLVVPQMYGVGYPVLENAVNGHYLVGFLVVLLLAKMLATSLTIGIGGSGGVFAPSLFVGAMLGAAFGEAVSAVAPGSAGPVGAYALIGMGAVFAGAARAPITAVVILFELTGEYSIILPLMTAIVLATGLSHAISADTVYTRKLLRRGVDLGRRPEVVAQGGSPQVRDAMQPLPSPVLDTAALVEVARALAAEPHGILPVVGQDGGFLGVITAGGVFEALADGRHDHEAVGLLTQIPTTVRVDDPLGFAGEQLARASVAAVPVLDSQDQVVGWLDERSLLLARTANA